MQTKARGVAEHPFELAAPQALDAEREELLEFLRGQVVLDPETGERIKPEAVEALVARMKPPEESTLEEIQAAAEARWGGPLPAPSPAWVEQVTATFSRAYPQRAAEFRKIARFVLRRPTATLWVAKPRPREHQPRRRRAGSSPRRARAPGRLGDDEPSRPKAPRRSLTAAERRFLKTAIDARRREIVAAGIALSRETYNLFAVDRAEARR